MSRRFFPLVALALIAAAPLAFARSHAPKHEGVPNLDLYGGYSYVFNGYDSTRTNLSVSGMGGWDASFKFPLLGPFVGIKGDVSGFSRNSTPQFNSKTTFFLLGPQLGFHIRKSTVFAHGMIGSSHVSGSSLPNFKSDTTFAVAAGGGFDYGIVRHLAWRLTGDFYDTHFHAASQNLDEIKNSNERVSTGPVIRF